MGGLNNCVVYDGKVYCWDDMLKQYVVSDLKFAPANDIPDEAIKLISMKRFNLVEQTQG